MAFLVVPVVGGAVGGLAGVSLAWSYTKAANTTAENLYGLHEAYPWPMYKPWFDHRVKSNATSTGTLAALALGTAAFSLQRRYLFKPVVRQLWGPTPANTVKIDSFIQFAKQVGPGLGATALSLTSTVVLVGLARPALDGNNLHMAHHADSKTGVA
ncbi:hypothetical protein ABBQ38_004261 [Trebouxia sp. C0009 RCD-2024]